ncbi:MAG: hypothetical protein ACW98I_12980 [Candidatus Hodarchaeales archaeon]
MSNTHPEMERNYHMYKKSKKVTFQLWHRVIGIIDSIGLLGIAILMMKNALDQEYIPDSGATPPEMGIFSSIILVIFGLVGLYIFVKSESLNFPMPATALRFVLLAILGVMVVILGIVGLLSFPEQFMALLFVIFVGVQVTFLGMKGMEFYGENKQSN